MSASCGFRKTLPTFGALPCRRKSFRVEVKVLNRSALSSVCWLKVWSTTNPRRARAAAGSSASAREIEPQRSRADCQVDGVPGTPTETPLVTRSGVNGYGCPVAGLMNASCVMAAGAVSRPSMVFTRLLFAS